MTEKFQTEMETHKLSLWLNNEEGIYTELREMAQDVKNDHVCAGHGLITTPDSELTFCEDDSCVPGVDLRYDLADRIKDWWEGYTDPDNWTPEAFVNAIFPMVRDVGSEARIDWNEIAEMFLED